MLEMREENEGREIEGEERAGGWKGRTENEIGSLFTITHATHLYFP